MPSDQLFKGTHMPSWSFLPLSLQTTQDPGCKVPRNVFGSAVAPHHDAISYHLKTWRLFLFSKYFKFQDFMVLLTLTSYCISALAEVPLLLLLLPKAHAHQWLTPAKKSRCTLCTLTIHFLCREFVGLLHLNCAVSSRSSWMPSRSRVKKRTLHLISGPPEIQ